MLVVGACLLCKALLSMTTWVWGNGDHSHICAIAKAYRSLLAFGVAANKAISKADVI